MLTFLKAFNYLEEGGCDFWVLEMRGPILAVKELKALLLFRCNVGVLVIESSPQVEDDLISVSGLLPVLLVSVLDLPLKQASITKQVSPIDPLV